MQHWDDGNFEMLNEELEFMTSEAKCGQTLSFL